MGKCLPHQHSQMRCRTKVEASRLSVAKGSIRGMQLFCPKKQKERKTWWAGPTLYFSEIGGLQVLTPNQSRGPREVATGPHQVLSCHLELRPQTGLDGSRPFVCLFNVQIRPTWMPVEKFQTLQRGCPQASLGPAHTWKPGFACTGKGPSDSRTHGHTCVHTCKSGEPRRLRLPVGRL